MKTYVPLHLHSDDSLLDGLGTISDYIKKAKEFFSKEIETNGEREIILLIKSFNEIFNNKSFINSNNQNYIQNCINNIVIALWNTIYFRQFNSTSRSYLSNFYINHGKYFAGNNGSYCGNYSFNK